MYSGCAKTTFVIYVLISHFVVSSYSEEGALRASPTGDDFYVRLRRARIQKVSACLHASVPSTAVGTYLLDRKGLPCMIREQRETKISFLWLEIASTWPNPALKEEREGVMQSNRTQTNTRTRPHRHISGAY
jgi:hypothetical protein